MDKNKIIGLIVIVGLAYLVWVMMSGDQYSAATTPEDCAKCEPAGVWTAGTCDKTEFTEKKACEDGEGKWTAGTCAAPKKDETKKDEKE